MLIGMRMTVPQEEASPSEIGEVIARAPVMGIVGRATALHASLRRVGQDNHEFRVLARLGTQRRVAFEKDPHADRGVSVLFRLAAAPARPYCSSVPGTVVGALTEAHVPTVGAPFTHSLGSR